MNSFLTHFRSLNSRISYDSDIEYRKSIRHIFQFRSDIQTFYSDLKKEDFSENEIDPESKDEMDLDMDALEEGMHIIFLTTYDNPLFRTLYEYAAGRMFSTDPKIGQAVLCSYDTFAWYFACIYAFLQEKTPSFELLPEYHFLRKWFSIP